MIQDAIDRAEVVIHHKEKEQGIQLSAEPSPMYEFSVYEISMMDNGDEFKSSMQLEERTDAVTKDASHEGRKPCERAED